MDRRQLLKRLDTAWEAFKESYAGLSDSQLVEPDVTGAWSVRDILLEGGQPPRYSVSHGGIDAFNARMTAQKSGLSLAEVRAQLDDTHRRIIAYPQHAQAIRKWREQRQE